MYKFGQNPSIRSWDRVKTSHLWTIWALLWPWKWGQGHQNLSSSFPCHKNIHIQVWSKLTQSFRRQRADKPFSNNLSLKVTLKIGSRSPKSNQFFSMSWQYSCASLVKIHPFIQEIGCRQAIFQLSTHVTLKIGSRSPKSNQFFYMSQQYRCASLVKIHLFLQEIWCRQAIFQHFPTI